MAHRVGALRDVDFGLGQLSAEADVIRAEERRQVLAALAALPRVVYGKAGHLVALVSGYGSW